ncbi:hypothetical protein DICPUDRAFT_95900 [Dictyostelium purpureum]|uniref:Uncharacterized protein n=1 Tax=Dictyostelium purpureum TaxID=5786 RepID=F1A2C3_DICPU|nr:uncharacterized protein DICPUDRAFT_95900 [Dictyostelium purpureum]EGC29648.1 hypothetical protein DICPUDRAFT_95900 [Dictyostelium purpureum]|eukprot:XP_003293817.1 hypothetical protein DICPUDRAFT_95900 [Dictyostelium purpureum]
MIYNQPLIEITKQGAVAVEEIKFSPPKLQSLIAAANQMTKNGPALKNKHILQLQNQHLGGAPQQSSIISLNSLNPYYAQQVLLQLQKPHNFIKHVHVVVKNTPFNITMRSNDPQFNFHNYVIKATLLYDSDPPKMVDFIHNEPLQYVATVSDDGTEVTVEVKVGILSSQHQGSMFLAVLHISHTTVPPPTSSEPIMTILNNIGNNSLANASQTIYNICMVSHPIRIVSKVDHVKKEGIPILKKKTFHEILTDKLKKLSKFQDGQSKWIKNLYQQHQIEFDMEPYCPKINDENSSNSSTPSLSSYSNRLNDEDEDNESDDDSEDEDFNNNTKFDISKQQQQNTLNLLNNNIKHQQQLHKQLQYAQQHQKQHLLQQAQPQQANNFQNSFNRVVEAFKYVPENERKDIIQKMVEQLRSDDLEQLVSTFMDELGASDTSSDTGTDTSKDSNETNCYCENCPSKIELQRFMNFFVPPPPPHSLFHHNTPTFNHEILTPSPIINSNNNNNNNNNNNCNSAASNNSNVPIQNDLLQLPVI